MFVSIPGFTSNLVAPLAVFETAVTLPPAKAAQLVSALGDGGYTYLTLSDATGVEVVKVSAFAGQLVLVRAQDGAFVKAFPRGACIDSRVTYAGIKDLICTHDCCAQGCPCEAVQALGVTVPAARVGEPWEGAVVFSGATPMTLAVQGAPGWISYVVGSNHVRLRGTAPTPGDVVFSVGATNCNGKVASQAVVLHVDL